MSGVQQGEGMPLMTAATRLVLIPPSVGRGGRITSPAWTRAGTRGSAPTPGGLQRQESRRPVPVGRGSGRPSRHGLPWGRAKQPIRQGGYSSNSKRRLGRGRRRITPPAMVATYPVAALLPVGRGRPTTTPAWMTRRSALVTGWLQEMSGVQRGEGPPSVTAASCLAVVPPPVEGRRRITTPAWTSVRTRGSAPTSGGLQRQGSRRPVPGRVKTEPSDRRGRTSSNDRPSPRPRARLRRRRSPPSGRSITTTLPPLQSGILGPRRLSASPVSGRSVR